MRAVDGLDDATIAGILMNPGRVALVGASARPERASNRVMRFLLERGIEVVPVNPGLAGQRLHGRVVAESLEAAAPFDLVDIFRNPAEVPPVVADAIRLGARVVWMQLGIVEPVSAARAREAGLTVVMDRCPAIEWPRLALPHRLPEPAP